MAAATSLKEYLKKYQSGSDDQTNKKKKKKKDKNPRPNPAAAGVLVVDEDPVWQKPVIDEEEESADDEAPLVDEDVEVKRLKRLEAIRSRKPYGGISEDGSGWVSISNSDLSPPHQRRSRLDMPSSDREPNADDAKDGDLSPPCQRRRPRRLDTPSPERRPMAGESGEANEDLSPPRRNRNRSPEADADLSPQMRSRNGSVDDLSPLRRNRNRLPGVDADLSPPRRRKGVVDDLSPPRRNRNRSPKVDADLSPPRRNRKEPVNDLSPPRRNRNQSPEDGDDLSSPRRSRQRLAEASRRGVSPSIDLSPPRRRKKPYMSEDEDLSPPRKRKEPSLAKESRTGLLSAEEIKKENDKKRKEEISRFAAMDPSMSGKGAQPVFRDKEGRRINIEQLARAQEEEKPKEKNLEWGKGLAQKREAEARIKDLELEKDKPFARTRDDPELDKMLKERIRWGDPMAHLVKKNSELVLEDLGTDEKMKESGFIVPQSIPSHSWIKRGIDFPPNRYGIRPGRHWDGVDRSNGYEKELFKRQNEKRATETEAYLWSVSDM